MNAPRVLTALYPPAVRECWGAEISREVAERGARSWADTVAGAARLWLHPSDWPETAAGQTRRVVAVAVFGVTATATLLLRTVQPPAAPGALALGLWLGPLAAGLLLAAPVPPARWSAWRRLGAASARTMAAPVGAVIALFAVADCGLAEHSSGAASLALLGYYWGTLAYVALRVCTLIARALRIAVVPTARRLRGALALVGLGTALAGGQSLFDGAFAAGAVLIGLAAVALHTGYDLRRS
jgi:hypothetical protein